MARDKLNRLVSILQRAMDAAGIHDEDPELLPERIEELRFAGATFVPNGQYPREGAIEEKKGVKGLQKGVGYLGGV